MAHGLVKNAFLFLMFAILARLLFFMCFGTQTGWEGLVIYSARAIETPMASFYYNYSYLPNIHMTTYIDTDTGFTLDDNSLSKTEAYLGSSNYDGIVSYVGNGVSEKYYTTGWY